MLAERAERERRASPRGSRARSAAPRRDRGGRPPSRSVPARKTARSRSGSVAVVRELLRARDVDLGELLADVARAGVQHEPDAARRCRGRAR